MNYPIPLFSPCDTPIPVLCLHTRVIRAVVAMARVKSPNGCLRPRSWVDAISRLIGLSLGASPIYGAILSESFIMNAIFETRISRSPYLTRAPLGYSAERAPLGGGGADSAPCLTPERMVVERRKKRQTKSLNKTNLKNTKNFT